MYDLQVPLGINGTTLLVSPESALLQEGIIKLDAEITDETVSNFLSAAMFVDSCLPKEKELRILINSPGGSVTDGFQIIDYFKIIKRPVFLICTGAAYSMAAFILASGKKGYRSIYKNGTVMIHSLSSGCYGTVNDMEVSVEFSKKLYDMILRELSLSTGKSIQKLRHDMKKDLYMDAKEAMRYGLVDNIITS